MTRRGRWLPVVVAGLVAVACDNPGRRPHGASGTMTVLYPGFSEEMFNPSWDMAERWMVWWPLARPDTGLLEGWLASSWEHSDDFRVWTIRLRDDMRWHDGTPVTAHDAKFTNDLWNQPDVTHFLAGITDSVVVVDDHTFRIFYRRPRFFTYWASYYPRHLLDTLDAAAFGEWEYWKRPVGNGAYRFARLVPKTMMEFEANPDFPGGAPAIGRIVVRFGGNAVVEMLAGNADVLPSADGATAMKLAEDPRFVAHVEPGFSWLTAIYWNHRDPRFADPLVRRALTLALDRAELNRSVNHVEDTPVVDGIFTRRQYRREDMPAALPYDRQEAGRLLDQAGWRDTDGDGVRERAGRPFRFSLLVGTGSQGERMREGALAVLIQHQLRAVGIAVEIVTVSPGVVNERIRSGRFEAMLGRLRNGLVGTVAVASLVGDTSRIGYRSAPLEAIVAAATRQFGPDSAEAMAERASAVMAEDLPVTVIGPPVHFLVAHRRIRGFEGGQRDPLANAHQLWIEER